MTPSLRRNHLFLALTGTVLLAGAATQAMASSIEDAINRLSSPDTASRVEAIDQLGAEGANAAEAVAPLTALLADESAEVRARAARSLGKIGEAAKSAAPELTSLLKDEDAAVRSQAVAALVSIRPGPKVMIPLFIDLMDDADPAVQLRVLQAVAEAGEAAVPGLIEALEDEDAAYWACLVLREIGPDAKAAVPALAKKIEDPDPEVRKQAVLALGAMGEAALPAVPQIAAALGDEHARTAATFVLGQLGNVPADAEATIRSNAKSEDRFLSTVSHWALARVHPEDKELRREATEQLVARLKDEDPYVRVVAARALAALPPAPEITIPIWEKAMEGADSTTILHALDALAALGEPAVPRLVNILETHEELRVEAAYALGQMGPAAAAATLALANLVGDENVQVATEAILALGKIGPAAADAVPALRDALSQVGEKNAHAIILALGEIGPNAAAAEPQVLEAMQSEDKSLAVIAARSLVEIQPASSRPEAAAKAVPVLVAGLGDPLPETRKAAADSLGALGPLARDAAPALESAAQDGNAAVRDAAAEALAAVRGPAVEPAEGMVGPGSTVVVVKDGAELKAGKDVLARLSQGTEAKVLAVHDPWIAVQVDAEGKSLKGWIPRSDIAPAPARADAPTPEPGGAE